MFNNIQAQCIACMTLTHKHSQCFFQYGIHKLSGFVREGGVCEGCMCEGVIAVRY